MDLKLYSKYLLKRVISPYMPRYNPSKKMLMDLSGAVPKFMANSLSNGSVRKRVLIASMGRHLAHTEGIYAKVLEKMGYEVIILTYYDPYIVEIFALFGIKEIVFYEEYFKSFSLSQFKKEAKRCVDTMSVEDILSVRKNGVNVGKYAASKFMRMTRKSSFDLSDAKMKDMAAEFLARSLQAAEAMKSVLKQNKPDLVFVVDRGYTPEGELFELCLNSNIPVVQRSCSQKSGWEIIRRYFDPKTANIHQHSLSEESWQRIKNMFYDENIWQELKGDLERTYVSGDWFGEAGTQFHKKVYSKEELISTLGIDPTKKTAVIFPHMFWDATFFYGKDLFKDYYEWFVNVIEIAAKNTNLNWVIKVHPANVVKAERDNYKGGHGELKAIYDVLGTLPSHIKVIPPESDINTFSLFNSMDYCLTVRGTIGIEAAAFGINTLTAGTGRYDRLGFTHDFDSPKEYLQCLASLEKIPPMPKENIELARKYAYGIFILRPLYLDLLDYGFNQDETATIRFRPLFKNKEEFESSSFVNELTAFIRSEQEDYLNKKAMTSYNRIGFMQGRLSPLVDGKIQAFPWKHWKDEFQLANKLGLSLMEWTLDYDRLEANPLMTAQGREEITGLCKEYKIHIPSLTGDFLMQKPFFKSSGKKQEHLFSLFLKVIDACGLQGIGKIIFPLVDHGRVANPKEQEILFKYLYKATAALEKNNVQVCFEFDLLPEGVCSFIEKLEVRLFAVNYDIGNSASLGYDFQTELKAYATRVTNVHVKDRLLHGTTVPLGQGNANVRGVMGWLKNNGYKGNYILQTARSADGKHAEVLAQYRDMLRHYLES